MATPSINRPFFMTIINGYFINPDVRNEAIAILDEASSEEQVVLNLNAFAGANVFYNPMPTAQLLHVINANTPQTTNQTSVDTAIEDVRNQLGREDLSTFSQIVTGAINEIVGTLTALPGGEVYKTTLAGDVSELKIALSDFSNSAAQLVNDTTITPVTTSWNSGGTYPVATPAQGHAFTSCNAAMDLRLPSVFDITTEAGVAPTTGQLNTAYANCAMWAISSATYTYAAYPDFVDGAYSMYFSLDGNPCTAFYGSTAGSPASVGSAMAVCMWAAYH